MSSRQQRSSQKGFTISPQKVQCNYCGCVVVAGPMGLVRHLASKPECQLEYSREHNSSCQAPSQSFNFDGVVGVADDTRIHSSNAAGSSGVVNLAVSFLVDDSRSDPVEEDFP
jgi:hypothetical protein